MVMSTSDGCSQSFPEILTADITQVDNSDKIKKYRVLRYAIKIISVLELQCFKIFLTKALHSFYSY